MMMNTKRSASQHDIALALTDPGLTIYPEHAQL